jgi:hypothetical protein
MESGKRSTRAQVRDHAPSVAAKSAVKKSRHAQLTLNYVLDRCHKWFRRIKREEELVWRDEKRIFEAFEILAKEKEDVDEDRGDYSAFLKEAEGIGGPELVVLLVLVIGKAAFRDMRGEIK